MTSSSLCNSKSENLEGGAFFLVDWRDEVGLDAEAGGERGVSDVPGFGEGGLAVDGGFLGGGGVLSSPPIFDRT